MDETAFVFRGMSEEQRKEIAEEMKGFDKVFILGDIRLYECPVNWITQETAELMRFCFLVEETGILPFPGAWIDQPCWFVEAFELYKREIAEWRKKNMPKVPNGK